MKFIRYLLSAIWKCIVIFCLMIYIKIALSAPVWDRELLGFPFPWRTYYDLDTCSVIKHDQCWPLLLVANLVFWIAVVRVVFRPRGKHKQDI